ncbi:MAG: hypothetical protein WCR36_00975 [Bacteroidaceae bacterium]
MKKLVIANIGTSEQGKSSSVKEVLNYLCAHGAIPVQETQEGSSENGYDIRIIVTYKEIRIGVESQGDPNSRILDSLPYFVKGKCDIIVCACRTNGATYDTVTNLKKDGYDVLWFSNPRFEQNDQQLFDEVNADYGEMVVSLIDKRINNG